MVVDELVTSVKARISFFYEEIPNRIECLSSQIGFCYGVYLSATSFNLTSIIIFCMLHEIHLQIVDIHVCRTLTSCSIMINKFPNSSSNFLTTYFDFAYFLFCSPFRLVSTAAPSNKCVFRVHKSFAHTSICFVLNSLGIYVLFIDLRNSFPSMENGASPTKYFDFLSTIFSTTFQLLTLKKFWLEQRRFACIVNYLKLVETHKMLKSTSKVKKGFHFSFYI